MKKKEREREREGQRKLDPLKNSNIQLKEEKAKEEPHRKREVKKK